MKRILFFAALVLGVVSCQKDQLGLDVDANGEAAVTVEVALSEAVTRVAGTSSALGAIDNGVNGEYDIRYTLEVYDNGGKLAKRPDQQYSKEPSTTFALRLIPGRNYRFVVWADFVKKDDHQVAYYNVEDLTNVYITGTHNAMNESRDAYTDVQTIENFGSASKIEMTLTRPFAKLRVVTNDMNEIYSELSTAKVVYTTPIYTAFNALDEKVAGTPENNITKEVNFKNEAYLYEGEPTTEGEQTLFADYLFGTEDGTIKFTLDVTDDSGQEPIPTIVFNTNIPVQRNYLTTIYGPVLTDANNVTVTIDDNFANWENTTDSPYYQEVWDGTSIREPEYNAETKTYTIEFPAELAWVADQVNNKGNKFAGKTVKLASGIDLGNERWTPIGATGKFEGTFDGSELTISNFVIRTEGKAAAGLFANAKYVRNVTVTNVDIESNYKTGAIVGDGLCSRIDNCHVDNARIVVTPWNKDEANHVGGIVGYLSAETEAWVKNCSVKRAEIIAFRDVAAIAGTANNSTNGSAVVSGCTVESVTITADQTVEYVSNEKDSNAGAIAGRLGSKAQIANDNIVADDVVVIRKVDSTKEMEYAVADAQNDETIYVGNGEAALPHFESKALYFVGIHENAAIAEPVSSHNDAFWQGAELNFTDLKIKGTSYTGDANGYVKSAKETYTNCKFVDGYYMFAGDVVTVDNGVFTGKYNSYFWTGSADVITFNKCKFNAVERAVKVCTVGHTGVERKVNFNECEFTATEQNKAALEIDGSKGSSYIVRINDCIESHFAKGANTGLSLFNVEGAKNVTVVVDGNTWLGNGLYENENGDKVAYSEAGLKEALKNGETTIYLNEGDYVIPAEAKGKTVAFVGLGNPEDTKVAVTKIGNGGENCDYSLDGSTVTFENITITTNSSTYIGYARCNGTYKNCIINGTYTLYGNSVFEGCTFNVSGDVYNIWTWGAPKATFTDCTFNCDGKAMLLYGMVNTELTMNNCVFNDNGTISDKAAIEVGNDYNTSYKLIVNNATVNGFDINPKGINTGSTLWANKNSMPADKLIVTIDGLTWKGNGLFVDAEGNPTVSSQEALNKAAQTASEITLLAGEYTMPATNGKDITIVGSRDVVLTVSKPNMDGTDVTFEGITVKGSGYATGVQHVNTVTYNNVKVVGEMCLYGEAVTFNKCEFELANGQYIWTYGCKNSTFNNCVFNTAGKAILVYNEGAGATNVTVKGCTFNASAGAKAGAIANQNCAAIEIDNYQKSGGGAAHNITTSNNTVGENFSGEWRIKNNIDGTAVTVNGAEYTQIAIDGKLMTIDASKNVTVIE